MLYAPELHRVLKKKIRQNTILKNLKSSNVHMLGHSGGVA